MIKKILLAIVLALPMCTMAQKFGTVEAESVAADMPEMKDIEAKLVEVSKTYEAEYQKLQQEVEAKYTEFQNLQKEGKTPQSILDRRQQEINELGQKAQKFLMTAQQEINRKQQELSAPVQEKVINAIKAVGQEGGYTMIFPAGVSLFSSKDVVDVTPLLRAKLGLPAKAAN